MQISKTGVSGVNAYKLMSNNTLKYMPSFKHILYCR